MAGRHSGSGAKTRLPTRGFVLIQSPSTLPLLVFREAGTVSRRRFDKGKSELTTRPQSIDMGVNLQSVVTAYFRTAFADMRPRFIMASVTPAVVRFT